MRCLAFAAALLGVALPVGAQQVRQAAVAVMSPVIRTTAIPLATGESLFVRFSVRSDTVVRVIGGSTITARGCGFSMFFARVWRRRGRDSALVLVDSVELQAKIASNGTPSDTTMDPRLALVCHP